jgi:hypothetical protein
MMGNNGSVLRVHFGKAEAGKCKTKWLHESGPVIDDPTGMK